MREMIRPGIVLLLFALVAAVCLGAVYKATEEPIAVQDALRKDASMKKLLPTASRFEDVKQENGEIKSLTIGYENDKEAGYIIGVVTKGYGGDIELLVALNTQGQVEGVEFVSQSETPGLGANAKNPAFTDQYKGKTGQLTVIKGIAKSDDEIEAITSATITTKAVTLGVNRALAFYQDVIKKGVQ